MSVAKNIVVNYIGRAWVGLMSLFFVPFYVELMGIEAYGLVGFYLTLLAIALVWSFSASTTLLRALAQAVAARRPAEEFRDSVRTLEVYYWGATALVGVAIVAASGLIGRWVQADELSGSEVHGAVVLMGIALLFQGPQTLYQGGLQGLDRQVVVNAILATGATLRGVVAVMVLALVSPTPVAFFATQALVSLLQTGAMAGALWRALPSSDQRPQFRRAMIVSVWRFTAGTTIISITAVVLMQTDKLLLSRMLPLTEFGYYSLASQVAISVLLLVGPVYASVFPRLSALTESDAPQALANIYNRASQLVAILVLPAAAVLAAFSTPLLLIWTGNAGIADGAGTLLAVLVIGSALNGLSTVPFALQLAHGWTRLALAQNLIAIALLAPAIIWSARTFGAVGAAVMWPLVNAGYVLIGVRLMHRRLLQDQGSLWYRRSFFAPAIAVSAVVAAGWLAEPLLPPVLQLVWIGWVFIGAVAAAIAATGSAGWLLPRLPLVSLIVGRRSRRGANDMAR